MTSAEKYAALAVTRIGVVRDVLQGFVGIFIGFWTVLAFCAVWISLDPSDPSRPIEAAVVFSLYPVYVWARAIVYAGARLAGGK